MSDLISRQAAIDAIRASTSKYTGFMEMEMYTDDDAVEAIEGLPSAQPEIIRCKDCKHNPKITWFGCPLAHCSETQRPETAWCWEGRKAGRMSDLISRQAAIDAYGDWYVEEGTEEGFIGTVKQLLEGLPPAQPEQSWIPCGERLPEHGGRYLISALDGINRRITVAPYLPRCKAWTMTGRMAYWKVIAWMPLPEPYKEDDHETD